MIFSCGNAEIFKSDLMKIAMTTLSSKILAQDKEYFAQLAVDAVMRLKVTSVYFPKLHYLLFGAMFKCKSNR